MDLIIGAGITGLSYAMFSKNNEYIIVEKEDKVGGYCKTIKRNGFVWDFSGHFFHFRDREIELLLMEHFKTSELVSPTKNTKVKYNDCLIEYPFQKNIHMLPKEEFIDCLVDLFALEDKPSFDTFKGMLYTKFGKSIAEKFLIPYNTKLYATDLDNLDKDAMGRFFPYAEKEEIIRNFREQDNNSYNTTFVYPKGGAIEYVNSILRHIDKDRIRLNTKVVSIDMEKKEAKLSSGECIKYDKVISTIPLPQLFNILNMSYDKSVYSWNKVLVYNLGFNKKATLVNEHWLYFPEKKYCFYRVGFYDNILDNNRASLYVELGFNKETTILPNMFIGKVLCDLLKAGIITHDMILEDYEAIIMDPAYVHITEKSIADVKDKKEFLASKDIYSIGRYGSWTYCSIEDNIKEARSLVNNIYK